MEGTPLESLETWQAEGETFETFRQSICGFFEWNCEREFGTSTPDFHWQMNLGVLRSIDVRTTPHIQMARLTSDSGFVQIQTAAIHDVVIIKPVKGYLRLTSAQENGNTIEQDVSPDQAMVYQPINTMRVAHAADGHICEAFIIKLGIDWVRRFLFDILRTPVDRDLHLGPVIDLGTPNAKVLSRLISTLCSDAFTFQSRHLSGVLQQRLMETFSQLLLESIPHRYSEAMSTPKAGPKPNHLQAARDFMHREAARNPGMAEVAKAANISVRTLETSFRAHLDTTPLAYLRIVRLHMAHEALITDASTRSIAEVAAAFGFPHAGRFAQYYTQMFGHTPSETRRRGTVRGGSDPSHATENR